MAKNKKTDIWGPDQEAEAPNRRSGPVQLSERWQRVLRWYIKAAAWSFPVFLIIVLNLYAGTTTPVVQASGAGDDQVDSAGKAAALIAENKWIDSVPAPVIGGQILSWDGFDVEKAPKQSDIIAKAVRTPDYTVEIHHFTIIDAAFTRYSSDVAVAVSDTQGASVIAAPSLNPLAPVANGTWSTQGAWYGLKSIGVPDAAKPAVELWAKAFTSGDPTSLRLAVGDTSASNSYIPLVGVQSFKLNLGDAGAKPVIVDGVVSSKKPALVVIQVTATLQWEGQQDSDDVDVKKKGDSSVTYDVLLDKANTAAPVVVAWGSAGSGPHLEPFGNAVQDLTVSAANE